MLLSISSLEKPSVGSTLEALQAVESFFWDGDDGFVPKLRIPRQELQLVMKRVAPLLKETAMRCISSCCTSGAADRPRRLPQRTEVFDALHMYLIHGCKSCHIPAML